MCFTGKLIFKNLEKSSIKDSNFGKIFSFSWKDYLKIDIQGRWSAFITNGRERGMMNIDRWISKWCHEITSISKCNETACQEKYVSLSNLYFFQEDCSSLSLVVRGSCLLIMQITGKSLIFVEILHKEKILLLDMMIHTVAKH